MAFRKTLARRLFCMSRITNPALTNCRISSSSTAANAPTNQQLKQNIMAMDLGDDGIFRRYLHRQSVAISPEIRSLPTGENMLEKLRGMDITRDRIRLEGLMPPGGAAAEAPKKKLTVEDVRRILRFSQLELVKERLKQIEKDYISYSDYLQICVKNCSSVDQGMEFAKMLDESGTVIVLGDFVLVRPEQVMKAIKDLIPVPISNLSDTRINELEELEKQKTAIDKKAELMVRRELWGGLGYLIIQTAAFMRLTFWELSWDVMEPICFYVTSMYFMAGYGFFLRTSREPSFEGFFQSRFIAKQNRLMKLYNFDIVRYNELKKVCYSNSSSESGVFFSTSFGDVQRT
ncbi:Hypothetical predicted protein [Olea europaea subsp. europaea]|uniref:Calcium uniporter protein C-terminal domain-containing protein n=2 Tax=Olea europaea subsp. europaea TaxID=158383 RepID=A0A8S0V5J9_OLEEU|nr:Hypothetical predicted protein [Olea europaea subsp. europaea]